MANTFDDLIMACHKERRRGERSKERERKTNEREEPGLKSSCLQTGSEKKQKFA